MSFPIHQHLHEAQRLAALLRAADAGHGQDALQGRPSAGPYFRLGHADATQRRVGEQRIGGDAVGYPARVVIQQIGGDDLEVIVGGVGEGAPAIDVTHGPDPIGAGPQLVVDLDIAARIGPDTSGFQVQTFRIGQPADREQ